MSLTSPMLKNSTWVRTRSITYHHAYGAWFTINIRRYILSNISAGNARFVYTGEGNDYFWLNVKGYVLTILTLGIYMFWWQKDQFDFLVN
ncbi:DUF898 family protein, partial [Segetibacter sp.]|uniref:DUF898 family protein n=1 Tax=Segetibacter sp. TaxID=2231182 RepID=UPI00262D10DA